MAGAARAARRARRNQPRHPAIGVHVCHRRADVDPRSGRARSGIRQRRVVAGLWSGFAAGAKVFRDPVPEPEAGQDWHALPVKEVQRLLPRPPQEHAEASSRSPMDLPPVHALRAATAGSWGLVRDFAAEMRANLADPITPLLATGAMASALLGSPLDAALVGGVLLANAALSAEQQLHAERILRRLLAVQDPLARRRIGRLDERRHEKVAAKRLHPQGHHRSPPR